MPDSQVSARIQVTGGSVALGELRAFRQALAEIATQRTAINIDDSAAKQTLASIRASTAALRAETANIRIIADTSQAGRDIAALNAQTKAMSAETHRIKVLADTSAATQGLRATDAETKRLTAQRNLIKLEVDSSPAMMELRKVEAEARRVQSVSSGGGGGAGSFALGASSGTRGLISSAAGGGLTGTALAGGSLVLATGLVAATKASIDLNSALQQAQITFKTFLGSTEAANAHLQELQQFAATTPFQFPDLVQASVKMQAMGFAARDVIPDLRTIGDAEAALGGGKEGIDRVVLALGQMQVKGHVAGGELLQLTEAGIPALQYLAAAYGKTTEEIDKMVSAGQVDSTKGVRAILAGLAADPKFAGQMEQQSKSFAGSMSNIQDSAQMALAQGLKPFFDEVAAGATKLAAFTASSAFVDQVKAFATALGDDISALKMFSATVKEIADPFLPFIQSATKYLPTILTLVNAIGDLSEKITGAKATREGVDKGAEGMDEFEIAKQRMKAEQDLAVLQAHPPQDFHGVRNRFSVIDWNRDKAQLQQTIDEYKKLGAAREEARLESQKQFGPALPPGYLDEIKDASEAFRKLDEEAYKANQLRLKAVAVGASTEQVSRAVYGQTGTGQRATVQQEHEAQDQIDALTAAQKQAAADRTAAEKQAAADQLADEKQKASDIAAVNKTAALEVETAWKNAESAVGQVDISKGLSGLADSAAGLDKVTAVLAAMGQSSPALSALTKIADEFKVLSDATDAASTAVDGYFLTFNETDREIKRLEGIKRAFDETADAAKKAKEAGTATPDQLALLTKQPAVDANLSGAIRRGRANQATDLLGVVTVVPNFDKLDQQMREKVAKEGGGEAIILKVQADKLAAEQQIKAMEDQAHATTLRVELDAKEAMRQIEEIAKDRTKTITVKTVDANGNQVSTDDTQGAFGSRNADTYNTKTVQVPVSGGSTATPRGDATALLPYIDLIKQAADKFGVSATTLAEIVLHESGGRPGAVQQNGLGRGLGQVDIGQNPSYDESRLTGTSRADIAYQLESAAKILAQMIASRGPVEGVQGYAGPAYRSQASGDVVGGLTLPDELARYYKDAVDRVLNDVGQRVSQGGPHGNDTLNPTGSGGDIGDAGNLASASNQVRAKIIAKALQSVDIDTLVGYCEQFVEETIQAITGKRGATGKNESSALSAFNTAQAKGLEVTQAQAKPGDLVYYGGGDAGHVAIYMGDGKQISTWDKGSPTGDNRKIHIEAIGPGAKFINSLEGSDAALTSAPVKIPVTATSPNGGTPVVTGGARSTGNTTDVTDTNTADAQAAQAELDALALSTEHVKMAQDEVATAFGKMDIKNITAAKREYETLLPIMKEAALAKLPKGASDETKQTAVNDAQAQSLHLTALWGQGLQAISSKSGDIAAVQKEISDTGGDIGKNLASQLGYLSNIAGMEAQIVALNARKAALESQHAAVLQQRQQADAADAAQQLQQQRQWQDAATARDRAHTMEQRRIQDSRTAESQRYEDESRGITRNQTLQQRKEQDEATGISRSHAAIQQKYSDNEQAINRVHAAEQRAFADNEQAIAREHAALQLMWRDEDQAAARRQVLQQRAERDADQAIARQHEAMQRMWADEARADAAAKTARDAAWTLQQRQQEDAKFNLQQQQTMEDRALQDRRDNLLHSGTLEKQRLNTVLQGNEDQTKTLTSRNTAQESRLQAQVEGASTNEGAQNAAESLALMKQQDAQALKALADAKTEIQKAIDAEDKLASEQLWAIDQEAKALSRAHEDAMLALDRQSTMAARLHDDQEAAIAAEIQSRADQHTALQQQWADEAQAIADIRQAAADRYADEQFAIQQTRQGLTDQWALEAQNRTDTQQALTRQWEAEALARSDAMTALQRQWDAEAQNRADTQLAESRQWADEATARDEAHTNLLRQQQAQDLAKSRSYEDESFHIQQTQLAVTRRHEDERIQIGLTRQAEDQQYSAALTAIGNEITAQQGLIEKEKEKLQNAQDALRAWDGVAQGLIEDARTAAQAASDARHSADQAQYYADTAGQSTSTGVPYSQFPAPGSSRGHADGGVITSRRALVGERGPELITAPGYHVTTAKDTAALLAGPSTAPVTVTRGATTYHINIHAQPGQSADEIAETVRAAIEKHDRDTSEVGYAAALGMSRN